MIPLVKVRTPCGPNALRFIGKRISLAYSSDMRRDLRRRVAACESRFRWNRIARALRKLRCSAVRNPCAMPSDNVGGADHKFQDSAATRGCGPACLGEARQSSLRGETRLLVRLA